MRKSMGALGGGEEKAVVLLQVFLISALESQAIFFQEVRETGRIGSRIQR
jgi:hypothetical protein